MKRFAILCMIYWQSIAHGFDPRIITAQVFVESSFRPAAVNKQCTGLMQVDYGVWGKVLGVTRADLLDPWRNIDAGLRVLRIYYRETGDIWKALHRYNNGYKHNNTRYVPKIKRAMREFYQAPDASRQAPRGVRHTTGDKP